MDKITYNDRDAIELLAKGDLPSYILDAAEYFGWAEPEAGAVFSAISTFMETLPADVLMETGAAAEAFAQHLNLSPEGKQYVLTFMGRARQYADADMTAPGPQKKRFGKTVRSNLWGCSAAVEAKKAGTFTGVVRLSKRTAYGAKGSPLRMAHTVRG